MRQRDDNPKPKNLREPVVIAEKPAGRQGEVLCVELSEFKGSPYLSQRKWFSNEAGELRPGKGLTVAVAELPWLVAQLERAEVEALRLGLLDEESYQVAGRPFARGTRR